jgi:Short C-terminal domain
VSSERMQGIAFISELGDLKDRGILTDEEFQRAKRKSQPLTGAAPSPDDDVAELKALRDRGILTDEEFERAKEKALAV